MRGAFVFLGWAQRGKSVFGSLPPRCVFAAITPCLAACLTLATSCADPKPDVEPPCGAPTPAFRFAATAVQTPLPDDLRVDVEFGGAQSESYTLGETRVGEVACCVTVAAVEDAPTNIPCGTTVSQDAAVAPNVIVCDLWTNGAVNLRVGLEDRVLVEQTLQAKLVNEESNCGQFQTLPAQWVLGESDAGVTLDGN